MSALMFCSAGDVPAPLDGLVRLDLLSGDERVQAVMTRYTARHLARSLDRTLKALDAESQDVVIPLCELCVRHDLPKHGTKAGEGAR